MLETSYIMELMGADATEREAECMIDVLHAVGIDTQSQVDALTPHQFFSLIPYAIEHRRVEK